MRKQNIIFEYLRNNPGTFKQVVGYYRTSSSANVGNDKDSLKRQKLKCEQYARTHNLRIVNYFYDKNVSGSDNLSIRPGFNSLLEFIKSNPGIDTIIFENASRFSRNSIIQELGYKNLKEKGIKLISASSPSYFTDDTDNPSIKMIRQILGSVSEFQKDELVLKLKGARERKKLINKVKGVKTLNGNGKCEGRKSYYELNPEIIKIAKRLRRKSPKTHKRLSLNKIALKLADYGYYNKNNKVFDGKQIERFLNV